MKAFLTVLAAACISLTSCYFGTGKKVKGNGNVTTDTRTPGSFESVEQKGSFDVELVVGEQASIALEGEENILSKIETYVDGSTLKIKTEEGFNLRPTRSVRIKVTAPRYKQVFSYGSGNIISESVIKNDEAMEVGTKGSGDVRIEVIAPEITASIYGSGNVTLKGQTRKVKLECTGSGDLNAVDLLSEDAFVDIKGSGNASVNTSKSLEVEVKGSGDVSYKGSPTIRTDFKGSGNLRKLD
jgi:endonuclease YncB( thermonuclease family)